MLTRRRFIKYSSIGALALSTGCKPDGFDSLLAQNQSDRNESLSLAERKKLAKLKNNFLGYPINMNTPPEGFFDWQRELRAAGIGNFAYNNVGNPFKESAIP